jgi:DNA sulfur modification protein DndD
MIIKSIRLRNYGLFKGDHLVQLSPSAEDDRHITLVSGQNGVGKSTILEALHLGLLGSLAIDSRLSETAYEAILYRKAHRSQLTNIRETELEIEFDFVKSGLPVEYKVVRKWFNDPANITEDISLWENGKELIDLTKKEKNLFLRELIQPGFAKVMFFDGERLSSLFEGNNLTIFLSESCRYLFGLNFIDQLKTDLNYFISKLHQQKDQSSTRAELQKTQTTILEIDAALLRILNEVNTQQAQIDSVRQQIVNVEEEISAQGRWATQKLDRLKNERQKLELSSQSLKKDIIELFNTLGPLLFCENLATSLKNRLIAEREIEKWQHTKEVLAEKLTDIKKFLTSSVYLKSGKYEKESKAELFRELKNILLAKPDHFSDDEIIHHPISDAERTKMINWIEASTTVVANHLKEKSKELQENEGRLKVLSKEQQAFSREDVIQPLFKKLQELNKQGGAAEQRLESLKRQLQEAEKRKDFYLAQYNQLQASMITDKSLQGKMVLAQRTKLALEDYSKELISKKVDLLESKVLEKFNLLCRKQNYFDKVIIDPVAFTIQLSRNAIQTDHHQLSAGEKQLLVLSILWSLRELTNISLPLIIDTPLARLDYQHRKSFLSVFLPAMQPQVILIGTDMEMLTDVLDELAPNINRHYLLSYDSASQANRVLQADNMLEGVAI